LGELLVDRGWTLSVAETTTGGLICARIVGVPGSSRYLGCGVVAYGRSAKTDLLGLQAELLDTHGAVSEAVAAGMADGVRRVSNTSVGLAETGVAGPVPGRSGKPLGSCWMAVSGPLGEAVISEAFAGSRNEVRDQIANASLAFLVGYLTESG